MTATYIREMVEDALSAHDGCCTAAAPCSTRERLASFHGIGGIGIGHELPQPRHGNGGNKTFAGSAGSYSSEPTEKQIAFLTKLLAERDILSLSTYQRDLVMAYRDSGKISKKSASLLIEALKSTAYSSKISSNGFRQDLAPKTEVAPLEPGIYGRDGKVIKVQVAKSSGHPYGLVLDVETKSFTYAPGAIKGLTPEHRLSLDEAKQFGRETGICCQCGAILTNEASIADGIGPICKGRWA